MKYSCKCGAVTLWSTFKQDLTCPHCKTELSAVFERKPDGMAALCQAHRALRRKTEMRDERRKENRMVYLLESIASVSITTPKPPVAWHSL